MKNQVYNNILILFWLETKIYTLIVIPASKTDKLGDKFLAFNINLIIGF